MPFFNSNDNIGPARADLNNFVDQTDAYANKFQTFISFLHIPSDERVYFKAMITTFSDSFSSQWSGEEVYGRADPIQIFKSTKRSITLGFDVVASTDAESFTNLARLQSLAQFLYPAYTDVSQAQTIAQSPLVRVGFMNIITDNSEFNTFNPSSGTKGGDNTAFNIAFNNQAENGLVCAITSLNYSSMGFEKDNSNTLIGVGSAIPRVINVSLSLEPVHRHSIGWTENGFATRENGDVPYGFPYAIQDPQSVHRANMLNQIRPSPKNYGAGIARTPFSDGRTASTAPGKKGDVDVKPPQNALLATNLKIRRQTIEAAIARQERSDRKQNILTGIESINNTLSDLNQRQIDKQETAQQQALADARYQSLGGKRRLKRDATGKTSFGSLGEKTAREYAAANNINVLEDK